MYAQFSKTRSNEVIELLNSSCEKPRLKLRQTENPKLAEQTAKVERYARSTHHVLLTGERGTGKTTIARQIHEQSQRRKKQFVSLNCATLKEELAEAELFGYEKGAFTGADKLKQGLFETGSGGTVFLDEIGELTLSLQAKLLKAVEEKRIRRVGASNETAIDLRIVAATSRDLRQMVARGEFRADLYDRLNVLSVNTIPLREQPEKIVELLRIGLERERIALDCRRSFEIKPDAFDLLEHYEWAGNFRELTNFTARLAIECQESGVVTKKAVVALLAEKQNFRVANSLVIEFSPEEKLNEVIERVKETYIAYHLQNKSLRQTAKQCGINRSMITRIADKFESGNAQTDL